MLPKPLLRPSFLITHPSELCKLRHFPAPKPCNRRHHLVWPVSPQLLQEWVLVVARLVQLVYAHYVEVDCLDSGQRGRVNGSVVQLCCCTDNDDVAWREITMHHTSVEDGCFRMEEILEQCCTQRFAYPLPGDSCHAQPHSVLRKDESYVAYMTLFVNDFL